MNDYVVAIDVATGTVTASWKGTRYRNYNDSTTHQFKLCADTKLQAEANAISLATTAVSHRFWA